MKIRRLLLALLLSFSLSAPALAADMPQAGSAAPPFSLTNQEGKGTALQSFRGKWVVLYFYPKDFSSQCSIEAHNFQESRQDFAALNAVILGVSVDSAGSHKEFCTKEGLNFLLLSDPDHKVSDLYGSVMDFKLTQLSARHTFIIDPNGVIRKSYADVHATTHRDEVLADLKALQK